jgi:Peptidylarginine deiminase and related enzymes
MIKDRDTNTVYFSEHILTNNEYISAFKRIQFLLDKHNVKYKFLTNTKDIWCRDYMPIQIENDEFVQFRYEPTYLESELELQSDPKQVLESNKITANFSSINLDGGNVIKWSDKAILTTRIFEENPIMSSTELTKELERLLKTDILFVPNIKDDMTGHADGHIRFIDSKTVLVNELKNELGYWRNGFLKMVKQAGLDFVEIPWFEHKDKNFKYSAIGGYVNYLEVDNLILFPVFEIDKNKDKQALAVIESVFPNRIIEPINVNEIANHGGLLNCTTWTVKQ